jgi:hypothetical protein
VEADLAWEWYLTIWCSFTIGTHRKRYSPLSSVGRAADSYFSVLVTEFEVIGRSWVRSPQWANLFGLFHVFSARSTFSWILVLISVILTYDLALQHDTKR